METLDWKSIGSLLATFIFLRTAIRDFLPPEIYQGLNKLFLKLFGSFKPNVSIIMEEFDLHYPNELYESIQLYLGARCFSSGQILKMSKSKNSRYLTFSMDANQKLEDHFNGFKVNWSFHCLEKKATTLGYTRTLENRFFKLTFNKKHKDDVHDLYLPHIMKEAETIKFKNKERRLYTNRSLEDEGHGYWSSVAFSHPSTFHTVAIDPLLKTDIMKDLRKFLGRKDFYSRVGRAWKRGYLLYGPPGTGKTSLIAAIANFIEFDIYDLELTAVTSNSQLRKLLISTSSKSIIVVEDVDCTVDLSDRKKEDEANQGGEWKEKSPVIKRVQNNGRVSLSGVLNFVDGLWSSCGGERLIIFTTNHKEKLDPALLRPGRMDKHIHLSYCDLMAFRTLAKNYLYLEGDHKLMKEIDAVLPLVQITPADVAEIFMCYSDDPNLAMDNALKEMKNRLILPNSVEYLEPLEEVRVAPGQRKMITFCG